MKVYKDRVEVDERLKGFQYPTGFEIYEKTDALKGWVVAILDTFISESWFFRKFASRAEADEYCKQEVSSDDTVVIGIVYGSNPSKNDRHAWFVATVMERT